MSTAAIRTRTAAHLLVSALLLVPAAAVAGTALSYSGDGEPILYFYDEDCGHPGECAQATLYCKPNGYGLTVNGLEDDTIIRWINDDAPMSVVGIEQSNDPYFDKLTVFGYDGTWVAHFALFIADGTLTTRGDIFSIDLGVDNLSLPMSGSLAAHLSDLSSDCAALW